MTRAKPCPWPDRLAVFDQGRIIQTGTPEDIYFRPQVPFVADFVGSSNVLPKTLVASLTGEHCPAAIRPERLRLAGTGAPERALRRASPG